MNLPAALLAPGHASPRDMHLVGTLPLPLALALASLIAATAPPSAWLPATLCMGVGLIVFWSAVVARTVLLAIDGRQLRIPAIERQVVLGITLYALLCVSIPTLILSLFGGPPAHIAMLLALCCAMGLAGALLPRHVAIGLVLVPLLLTVLPASSLPHFKLPGPDAAGSVFWYWTTPVLVALLLTVVACWRRLLHERSPYVSDWRRPLVIQNRLGSLQGGSSQTEFLGAALRSPAFPQPPPTLGDCGPTHPVRSLRIALGGMYRPQTWRDRVLHPAFLIGAAIIVVTSVFIIWSGIPREHPTLLDMLGGIPMLVSWLGSIAIAAAMAEFIVQLQQRWNTRRAELDLLALLPGLHERRPAKRNLLLAALIPPLLASGSGWLLMAVASIVWHGSFALNLAVMLTQLVSAGALIALTLSILAGRPLPSWVFNLSVMAYLLMLSAALMVVTVERGSYFASWQHPFLPALISLWLLLASGLGWLGRRSWRAMQQQAHPFVQH